METDYLENTEKAGDRKQCRRDFVQVRREGVKEEFPQGDGMRNRRHDGFRVVGAVGAVNEAQNQHGDNRPHGTKGNQAETVVGGVAVAPDGGNTDTEGHDKRNGHRPGRDAAGIERHRQKVRRRKKRKDKQQSVGGNQHGTQSHAQQDTQ